MPKGRPSKIIIALSVTLIAASFGAHGKAQSLSALLDQTNSPEQLMVELRSFQSSASSDNQKYEAAYVLARLLQKTTQPSSSDEANSAKLLEAMRLYDDASSVSSLSDRAAWHIAEIAVGMQDEERARAALSHLARKGNTAKSRSLAEYWLAQSYVRSHENEKAAKAFLAIRKNYPDSDFARAAFYYLAELEVSAPTGASGTETGSTAQPSSEAIERAITLYRQYIKSTPDGKFASAAVTRLLTLTKTANVILTDSDHDAIGQVYFAAGRYNEALSEWSLTKGGANSLRTAICFANTGKKEEAQRVLLSVVGSNPKASYKTTAALICNLLTRDEAKAFWQKILVKQPVKDDAPLWNIAIRSKSEEAIPLYKKILATYPTSEYAPECVWWIFWDLVKQSKTDPAKRASALAIAHDGLTKYPTTKTAPRLAFWSGKLYEQLKRTEDARVSYQFGADHFPTFYYGHRCKSRLRALAAKGANPVADSATDNGWTTHPARIAPNINWHWAAPEEVMTSESMQKRYGDTIAELIKLRQYDEALELLPSDAGQEFKAALYAGENHRMQAINAANVNLTGAPKLSERWEMAYPLEFGQYIADAAKTEAVDPLLVHALIREESRYNPDASSRVKAIGLMQLMPGTAQGVAKRIGVPLTNMQDVFHPDINIKLGTNYLAYTIKRFDGNALLAVASYNGGPNAVNAWLKEHKLAGQTDFDVFVENIPYRETRDYVRKVFGSYWTYEELYTNRKI